RELGVEVKAPTDTVWIHPDGTLTVGPTPDAASGGWSRTTPSGESELVEGSAQLGDDALERADEAVPAHPVFERKAGDPAFERSGPARSSHPEEYERIMEDLKRNDVPVIERPNGLAYQPSDMPGRPGELYLDPEASYSAVLHEYQHYLDDAARGFPGKEELYQLNVRWTMEQAAYAKEIAVARRAGDLELIRELRALRLQEWQKIFMPQLFQ
ncbi:MAG: hypothetical protein ABMA64_37855, partial [Myxococcota bacterium]